MAIVVKDGTGPIQGPELDSSWYLEHLNLSPEERQAREHVYKPLEIRVCRYRC
jgi:hypothetical protein